MARLILPVVGAAIGAYVGGGAGASWGPAIGCTVGGGFDEPEQPAEDRPELGAEPPTGERKQV